MKKKTNTSKWARILTFILAIDVIIGRLMFNFYEADDMSGFGYQLTFGGIFLILSAVIIILLIGNVIKARSRKQRPDYKAVAAFIVVVAMLYLS